MMALQDDTIDRIVRDSAGREASATRELLGVLANSARNLPPDERTGLAVQLARLARELDPDVLLPTDH